MGYINDNTVECVVDLKCWMYKCTSLKIFSNEEMVINDNTVKCVVDLKCWMYKCTSLKIFSNEEMVINDNTVKCVVDLKCWMYKCTSLKYSPERKFELSLSLYISVISRFVFSSEPPVETY